MGELLANDDICERTTGSGRSRSLQELLEESGKPVFFSAPMVRYSKLEFRQLVRKYNCHACYTPMIFASCFLTSERARNADLTTCPGDRPLVVQFAASCASDFAQTSEMLVKQVDGVDLNCGCPQRRVRAKCCGSYLLNRPDLISDIVRQTRQRVGDRLSLSIKIRLHNDLKRTVDLCRQAESAGISYITVHGRTPSQRGEPVDVQSFKTIKESLRIPVVANGDIFSLDDAYRVVAETGVNGVMAARGLLHNPALFTGAEITPVDCVKNWVEIALSHGMSFSLFHHHLSYMIDRQLPRYERRIFHQLGCAPAVIDYLRENFEINFFDSCLLIFISATLVVIPFGFHLSIFVYVYAMAVICFYLFTV